MNTMNYSKVTMTDSQIYTVSSHKMPLSGMKKNHIVKESVNGIQYIVNVNNGRAYRISH